MVTIQKVELGIKITSSHFQRGQEFERTALTLSIKEAKELIEIKLGKKEY